MNYFIYLYIISLLTGRYELNKLTSLPMCGFIAQLVEHRTGIAEVTGSNPVEALIFFRLLLSSCLNWKIHCEDHSSLSSITAVHMNYFIYLYIICSDMINKDVSTKFYQKCFFLCNYILLPVLRIMSLRVVTMGTYWVSDFPNTKGFWRSILILAQSREQSVNTGTTG